MKAHAHAAGALQGQESEALGQSRGGFTTKIHARVDGGGRPFAFELSPGQTHEIQKASALMNNFEGYYVVADRGYDSEAFKQDLLDLGLEPVIPSKSNRNVCLDYDKTVYKKRNVIERFFARIKQFRRIATRYDKTANMFQASLLIASIFIWLKV